MHQAPASSAARETLSIGERLKADQAVFMPLPAVPYDPCHKVPGRVSSMSLVRYRTNDYSVSTQHAYQDVLVKGYVSASRSSAAGRGWLCMRAVISVKTSSPTRCITWR